MIKQCMQWLASKNFLLVDLLLLASMAGLVYASWPSLQVYSRWTAIALLAIMVLLASIGLVALGGQIVFMLKRKAIDTQVYGRQQLRQQLSLPLPSLPPTKVDEEHGISAPVSQKRLPRSSHVLQGLQPAKVRSAHSATPANLQRANVQRPFATGYRPPSNAVANPQPANLQIADDTDKRIAEAAKELQSKNIKVTGIAIAEMTGIAERTVYDRISKMRKGGTS